MIRSSGIESGVNGEEEKDKAREMREMEGRWMRGRILTDLRR